MQAATNEIVVASVMCLPAARLDRPMAAGRSSALRHFSVVRKLDGLPFPPGAVLSGRTARTGRTGGGTTLQAFRSLPGLGLPGSKTSL